jgi:signal peptidase II
VTDRNRNSAVLLRIALLVAVVDYITKDAAVRWVSREPAVLSHWVRFAVVHNQGAAFGLSLGAYTWQLNLILTLAAIGLVVPVSRDLARVDRGAPIALGLIVGGALGNLASLVLSPRGVIDFIAVSVGPTSEIVLNVADVAAYVGLALVIRTGFLIVAAIRRDARPAVRTFRRAGLPSVVGVDLSEREVLRAVYREPVAGEVALLGADLPADRPDAGVDAETPGTGTPRVLEFPLSRREAAAQEVEEVRAPRDPLP